MARIVVFGNEKGGAGKSTLAIHIISALLYCGKRVALFDLDVRQRSTQTFFENRMAFAKSKQAKLPQPMLCQLNEPEKIASTEQAFEQLGSTVKTIEKLADFVVLDCPGALTPLSMAAHQKADTLVTPLNDSYIDFDLLAKIDPETGAVGGPSVYAEMVWEARKGRALQGGKPIDWVVCRNRLSPLAMHNKRKVGESLEDLAKRIGFRLVPGVSDRVIYKELFPQGLTLLDHRKIDGIPSKLSNVAARQELRDLVLDLQFDQVDIGF